MVDFMFWWGCELLLYIFIFEAALLRLSAHLVNELAIYAIYTVLLDNLHALIHT